MNGKLFFSGLLSIIIGCATTYVDKSPVLYSNHYMLGYKVGVTEKEAAEGKTIQDVEEILSLRLKDKKDIYKAIVQIAGKDSVITYNEASSYVPDEVKKKVVRTLGEERLFKGGF